jgi:hypothetical protein
VSTIQRHPSLKLHTLTSQKTEVLTKVQCRKVPVVLLNIVQMCFRLELLLNHLPSKGKIYSNSKKMKGKHTHTFVLFEDNSNSFVASNQNIILQHKTNYKEQIYLLK